MATAERLGVPRILTVDERDFRAVRPLKGPSFCCRVMLKGVITYLVS